MHQDPPGPKELLCLPLLLNNSEVTHAIKGEAATTGTKNPKYAESSFRLAAKQGAFLANVNKNKKTPASLR